MAGGTLIAAPSGMPALTLPDGRFVDAQSININFARSRSNVINARAYMIEYDDLDFESLVPVDRSVPEWANGIDTYVGDIVGKADWYTGAAKDIPIADTTEDMITSKFSMFAVGYQWNLEELGKAQFMNFPLSPRRAMAARRAAREFEFVNAISGSVKKKYPGLINQTGVTPTTLPADGTGSATFWVNNSGVAVKTPAQIVRDMDNMVLGPVNPDSTAVNVLADTLLLPPLAYRHIATTPYGETSPNKTILQYYLDNNLYRARTGRQVTIRELPQLSRAATQGTVGGGRALAYRNTSDVLTMYYPMPFRFLPVYQDGPIHWTVPGIGRIGQVDVMLPYAFRYFDGVTPVPA